MTKAPTADWKKRFQIKESGFVVYPARVVMDFNQVEELVDFVLTSERNRLVGEVEKMKTIEKVMKVFPDGSEIVENTGLVRLSDVSTLIKGEKILTNQGETK